MTQPTATESPESILANEARYDAIVVGARCAGASTAMLLARAGQRVLLVDRAAPGTDTLSTHALMRTAVVQLARWGVLPKLIDGGAPLIHATAFHYGLGADRITARVDIEPQAGAEGLLAPRRQVLDAALVDAAREAGVEVRHGVGLTTLRRDCHGRVIGAQLQHADGRRMEVSADWVIGADGRNSTVARQVRAATLIEGKHKQPFLYSYFAGLERDCYHWHYTQQAGSGVIPTHDGLACVFTNLPEGALAAGHGDLRGLMHRSLSASAPELSARLRDTAPAERIRGFRGQPGFLKQCWGPGWALVGDAGYFKDPITAHGISDALRDAELLARALGTGTEGALRDYERTRNLLSRGLFDITERIASWRWTLPELQQLHRGLSKEIAREVAWITTDPAERAA